MNKQDITIVVLLFAALLAWMVLQKGQPGRAAPTPAQRPEAAAVQEASATTGAVSRAEEPRPATPAPETVPAASPVVAAPGEAAAEEPVQRGVLVTLTNASASVTLDSRGAGVVAVEMDQYPATLAADSGPVLLDFSALPALTVSEFPGFSRRDEFEIASVGARAVRFFRAREDGLRMERTVTLATDSYALIVEDVFSNAGPAAVTAPAHGAALGPMRLSHSGAKMKDVSYLGLDTLATHGGEGVKYWGAKLSGWFGARGGFLSRQKPDFARMGATASQRMDQPMSWVAAKDRFFVQILAPQEESAGCELTAWRDTAVSNAVAIGSVSARMLFPEKVLKPGETAARTLSYYAGPKKHALLRRLGGRQDDVMEFGFFAPVCKPLLWCLNYLYRLIPNYGVAVILLTALVRLLFWPVTHKSTESMKKMQSLQPQVAQIREKFKDKPQKMNQEIMALYRENKVNPMSGCLPVLVQIPVFIALYTVLRSAIELRFAPFLWVHDLSEPEGLLAGKLPFVSALNILPLFMTATMVWQQKLTPTAGDPQQQKMMVMMPVVMLFIFYSMPSALVLYWSVSQCLSIVQLLMQRRTSAARAAPSRP